MHQTKPRFPASQPRQQADYWSFTDGVAHWTHFNLGNAIIYPLRWLYLIQVRKSDDFRAKGILMKTILMATTALAISASASMAADFPIYNPIDPAPAAYDWTGFYVGVNAGYGGGNFNYPVSIDLIVPDGFEDLDIDEQEEFLDDLPLGIGEGLDPETLEGGDVISLATGSADLTAGGFVGGLQAGYNFMASESILLGIEADIQASSISGTVTASIDTPVSTDLLERFLYGRNRGGFRFG